MAGWLAQNSKLAFISERNTQKTDAHSLNSRANIIIKVLHKQSLCFSVYKFACTRCTYLLFCCCCCCYFHTNFFNCGSFFFFCIQFEDTLFYFVYLLIYAPLYWCLDVMACAKYAAKKMNKFQGAIFVCGRVRVCMCVFASK